MDSQFLQYKINGYYAKDDPYMELNRCFNPCIKNLKTEETTVKETKCFSNCLNKHLRLTNNLRLQSSFYMKQRNDKQNHRNYIEVQMNKKTEK